MQVFIGKIFPLLVQEHLFIKHTEISVVFVIQIVLVFLDLLFFLIS